MSKMSGYERSWWISSVVANILAAIFIVIRFFHIDDMINRLAG